MLMKTIRLQKRYAVNLHQENTKTATICKVYTAHNKHNTNGVSYAMSEIGSSKVHGIENFWNVILKGKEF